MRYTSRYDHGMGSMTQLQVPMRHAGRRRHHDTMDGPVGFSTQGAAEAIQPRSDSPSFMSSQDRHLRKSAPYIPRSGLGRVHGWQQGLVEADHKSRHDLASGRQSAMNRLRDTQAAINQRTSDRRDARREMTCSLKSDQRFRYFRTV